MHLAITLTRHAGGNRGLLRLVHRIVQRALHRIELTGDGIGAGDVAGVAAGFLGPGVREQQPARRQPQAAIRAVQNLAVYGYDRCERRYTATGDEHALKLAFQLSLGGTGSHGRSQGAMGFNCYLGRVTQGGPVHAHP